MDSYSNRIKSLIAGAGIGEITSIVSIGNGYASSAYKISSSKGEFVALTPRNDCIEQPNYTYYFSILKALEELNYEYAPKPIYVNLDQSVMVMTYVSGQSISCVDNSSEKDQKRVVETLVDALIDLRRVDFEHCKAIYKKICGKELKIDTLQKSFDHYITEWFDMAKNGKPDQTLIDWIRPKVLSCKMYVQNSRPGKKIIFNHEDVSAGNVLVTPDLKLNLIDWDTSSFYQYPDDWDDYGMGYLFNHLNLFQKHRPFTLSFISDKCGIKVDRLEKAIAKSQEFIKLCDIMWAIMMNSRVAAGEINGNPSEFLQIAKNRISEYEVLFGGCSFLND